MTKNTALRNLLADAFGGAWDQGGEAQPSKLEILHSDGSTVLAIFDMNADAFGAAANGVASMAGLPKTVQGEASGLGAGVGVATTARLISADGATYQLTGLTVGTSGANVILNNTSINEGQGVTLQSFTWTEQA